MKPIALLYARRDVGGGSTSFTVHLYRAMQMAGIDVKLYRIAEKSKDMPYRLAKYAGVHYWQITPVQARALVCCCPMLLVAPEAGKNLPESDLLPQLMEMGMRIVVHDPNELKVFDHLQGAALVRRPICIRPTMRQFYGDAVFIPHPYVRVFEDGQGADLLERKTACSIARITFVKRTNLILEANEKLPKRLQVQLHGAENRLFTRFKLQKDFPAFKQGGYNLPFEHGVSARAAREYTFAIDFTFFPHDGGGSQYTFMEAWDAGTVNIIHFDWLRYSAFYSAEMKHGENCLAVNNADELAALLRTFNTRPVIRRALGKISLEGERLLRAVHDPTTIARTYYKELTR